MKSADNLFDKYRLPLTTDHLGSRLLSTRKEIETATAPPGTGSGNGPVSASPHLNWANLFS